MSLLQHLAMHERVTHVRITTMRLYPKDPMPTKR